MFERIEYGFKRHFLSNSFLNSKPKSLKNNYFFNMKEISHGGCRRSVTYYLNDIKSKTSRIYHMHKMSSLGYALNSCKFMHQMLVFLVLAMLFKVSFLFKYCAISHSINTWQSRWRGSIKYDVFKTLILLPHLEIRSYAWV